MNFTCPKSTDFLEIAGKALKRTSLCIERTSKDLNRGPVCIEKTSNPLTHASVCIERTSNPLKLGPVLGREGTFEVRVWQLAIGGQIKN